MPNVWSPHLILQYLFTNSTASAKPVRNRVQAIYPEKKSGSFPMFFIWNDHWKKSFIYHPNTVFFSIKQQAAQTWIYMHSFIWIWINKCMAPNISLLFRFITIYFWSSFPWWEKRKFKSQEWRIKLGVGIITIYISAFKHLAKMSGQYCLTF